MTYRVVSTDRRTAEVIADAFTWQGMEAEVATSRASTADDVVAAAEEADALVVDATTPVTQRVLEETDVRVVGRAGAGVDNVDLDAAHRLRVPVVNVPGASADETATHALSLLLATWRSLRPLDAAVRAGNWSRDPAVPTSRLAGKTLGLLGFGAVGKRVAELVGGFDLTVLATDPYVGRTPLSRAGAEPVGLAELCRRSDLLSVQTPLTGETRGLVDADALGRLPQHAVVVNVGRGEVVDAGALADALDSGAIAGAGLDVLPEEPPGALPTDHPNVVYTPHVGWYSEAAVRDCADHVAGEVARVLRGESPTTPVEDDW